MCTADTGAGLFFPDHQGICFDYYFVYIVGPRVTENINIGVTEAEQATTIGILALVITLVPAFLMLVMDIVSLTFSDSLIQSRTDKIKHISDLR